ncbi:MAG TPA: CPBP family intramembrane glutamic endopeptidase [Candidatus Kryptonia bacterium]
MTYKSEIARLKTFTGSDDFKPSVILILAALVPAAHKYFMWLGTHSSSGNILGIRSDVAVMFAGLFILFGVMPALIIRYLFHEGLREYGITAGNWRDGAMTVLILFPLIALLLLYPSSFNPEMRMAFPYDKSAGNSLHAFARFESLRGIFFYPAWEFFFWGFLLFGLRRSVGDNLAICIQTIPSCMWHIGGPGGELFASIAGGILFGMMALRTKSILWPFILHFLIGVTTDFFVVISSVRIG